MLSSAERLAAALVTALAAAALAPYLTDALGYGLLPRVALAVALIAAASTYLATGSGRERTSLVVFILLTVAVWLWLLWRAWPSLLPPGSGPDLTHHLMLIDYLQRHGTLVHDPDAWRALGEMAHYTPGLHTLAVVVAAAFAADPLFALYPLVSFTVALKLGFVALIAMRATPGPGSSAWGVTAAALAVAMTTLTFDSFTRDSFLAQAVAELFAVAALWSLTVWAAAPSRHAMALFGVTAAAAFLTWPVWIGPVIGALTLTIVLDARRPAARLQHALIAAAPVLAVAAWHAAGRIGAVGIVGTSGAVTHPGPLAFGIATPALALAGLILAWREARTRPIVWMSVALAAQTLALLAIARAGGAATPYMAIKMSYLAVYPLSLAAAIAAATVVRHRGPAWIAAALAITFAAANVSWTRVAPADLDADLYAAGRWVREQLPPSCVDYLVGNEYTAYWLHLAVLRNERMSPRSADDDLYLTGPSYARWIERRATAPYAIARVSLLPREIRESTRVLHRAGDAVVLSAVSSRPAAAGERCDASPLAGPL